MIARFVGGPWHNRVDGTGHSPRLPVVKILEPEKLDFLTKWDPDAACKPMMARTHEYRLCRFFTEYGTIYEQYVHESLMRGGEPNRSTYDEALPSLERSFLFELAL